jgi:hypothetical protein
MRARVQSRISVSPQTHLYPAGPRAGRVSTLRRVVPSRAFDKQIRKHNQLAG